MEPQMRKLRYLLHGKLTISYIMGGLLNDWRKFSDQLNNINRPAQMGPLWMEARQRSGQPIDESIWIFNPVDTSYIACLAVKAAKQQSPKSEEAMLRKLREKVMIHQKNIGEVKVILETSEELEREGILDKEKFQKSFFSNKTSQLFKKDLDTIKIKGITRFPTLLITYTGRTLQITGYRPFSVLLDALTVLEPELKLSQEIDEMDYRNSWKFLTVRELSEISSEKNYSLDLDHQLLNSKDLKEK